MSGYDGCSRGSQHSVNVGDAACASAYSFKRFVAGVCRLWGRIGLCRSVGAEIGFGSRQRPRRTAISGKGLPSRGIQILVSVIKPQALTPSSDDWSQLDDAGGGGTVGRPLAVVRRFGIRQR